MILLLLAEITPCAFLKEHTSQYNKILNGSPMKRLETIGDFFEKLAKSQFGNLQELQPREVKRQFDATSKSVADKEKYQDMEMDEDDVFSVHEQDNYSARFDVKSQAKEQYDKMKEDQQINALKTRPVTQFLQLREENAKKPMRIKLDFIEPTRINKKPALHFEKFKHEDVWDPARQLRYKMSSDKICISNMVELPAAKHVLNKPKPYKPLQPLKKKMYRPPVPRIFRNGYDEFLSRRAKNKIGEIDLGVLHVDEVLEECYRHNVIPLYIFNQFINTNGHLHIRRYLQKWTQAELHLFDFQRTCFTLLDHRRLSQLLLHLHPELYTLGSIEAFHPDVKEFIERTYYLSSDEYVQLYLLQDEISECTWWGDIKIRVQEMKGDSYFQIKETIQCPPLPAEMQYNKQKKSDYMRDLLGPLNIQDSEKELQKILSMKYKNQQRNNTEGSVNSYNRNEQDEQFQESHDRNTDLSFNQNSAKGQNSGTGQEWQRVFGEAEDRGNELYEED